METHQDLKGISKGIMYAVIVVFQTLLMFGLFALISMTGSIEIHNGGMLIQLLTGFNLIVCAIVYFK